jgi:hypothetical protein
VTPFHAHRTEEQGPFFPEAGNWLSSAHIDEGDQPPDDTTLGGLRLREAALRSIETGSKSGDRDRIRDTTSFPDRSFDVSFDRSPEILVRHGALDQAVELTTRERKLLRGLHPGIRRRRKRSEELRQPLFVECRHVCHRSPDGSEGSDLPSSWARSFLRQREMRLAIVPGAMARASPIV